MELLALAELNQFMALVSSPNLETNGDTTCHHTTLLEVW